MLNKKSITGFLIVMLCLAGASLLQAQDAGDPNTGEGKFALVGGTLIDGLSNEPLANAVVLVEEGVITAVGEVGELPIPAGFSVISTEGRTVMPGLWDMHVHLLYAGHTNFPYWHQTYTDQFADIIMPATALQLLQAGVTSARDLGAPPESIFRVRERIASNEIPGPTLYASGPQLTPQPPAWGQYYRRNIAGQDNARREALLLVEQAADILKVSNAEGLEVNDVRTVVDIAHERGLLVTAHGRSDAEIAIGLAGGIDEFQHIGLGSDAYPPALMAQIESRIARGEALYWTPTAALALRAGTQSEDRELLDAPENYLGLPSAVVGDIQTALQSYAPEPASADIILRKINQLRAAGVTLLVGTDAGLSGNPHAQALWQEMLAWVEVLGMDPMQTIQAATSVPAEVMGVADRVGSLRNGMLADIIVVPGNPLLDMAVLRDPVMVMKGGRVIFSNP